MVVKLSLMNHHHKRWTAALEKKLIHWLQVQGTSLCTLKHKEKPNTTLSRSIYKTNIKNVIWMSLKILNYSQNEVIDMGATVFSTIFHKHACTYPRLKPRRRIMWPTSCCEYMCLHTGAPTTCVSNTPQGCLWGVPSLWESWNVI